MAPPNNYRLWTISPSQTGISANYSNVDNFIKNSIEKEISFKETHRDFWGNLPRRQNLQNTPDYLPPFYFLKSFYKKY